MQRVTALCVTTDIHRKHQYANICQCNNMHSTATDFGAMIHRLFAQTFGVRSHALMRVSSR